MAIQATITTQFGEDREVYIRLNNVEASNHGADAHALFRGFLSEEAFQGGASYVWEREIDFPCDVSAAVWPQAYAALVEQMELDPKEV